MSDPFEAAGAGNYPQVQWSFFVGGKDQFCLRAGSVAELVEMIEDLTDSPDGDESKISKILNGTNTVRSAGLLLARPEGAAAGPVNQSAPRASAPEQPQDEPGGRACRECGSSMTFRSGTKAATGRPWAMWKCSANDKHIEWVNLK